MEFLEIGQIIGTIDMTLEERIKQEKLRIEENKEKLAHAVKLDNQDAFDICMQKIEEHEQLVAWLEELKANKVASAKVYAQGYKRGYNDGYNKDVNDLMQKCDIFSGLHKDDVSITIRDMSKIAERLKKKG